MVAVPVVPEVEVAVVPEVVVAVVAVCIVPEVSVEVPDGMAEVLVALPEAVVSVVDIVLDIAVSVVEVVEAVSLAAAVSVLLFSVFEQAMPKVESAATVRRTRSDFFILCESFLCIVLRSFVRIIRVADPSAYPTSFARLGRPGTPQKNRTRAFRVMSRFPLVGSRVGRQEALSNQGATTSREK